MMHVALRQWVLYSLLLVWVNACNGESGQGQSRNQSESPPRDEPTHSESGLAPSTNIHEAPDRGSEGDPPVGAVLLTRSGTTCQFHISWQLGEIDERFNLSPTDVDRAMNRVQQLWAGALEQFELTRAPDRGIVIDFQYDDRQELVDGESAFQERLREQEILIEQRQTVYDEKRREFDRVNQAFLNRSETIQQDLDALNRWVRDVNDGGGFTDEQIERYEAEKSRIEQLQVAELASQAELQDLADQVNEAMVRLNEENDRRNEMIDHYNETFAGQRLFTSGHFQRTEGRDTITIFQFQGETGLQRVLAHELGHAMGLTHLNNPEAIMFERVSGHSTPVSLRLTADDRNALRERCMALQP